MAATPKKRHFVIVGGGIMGCTTAYFLTRHPSFQPDIHRVTILEASTVAAGASGKAGGLLALWAFPSCLVELSFKLHAELAAEHGGEQKWGYRANLGVGTLEAQGKTPEAAFQSTLPLDGPQHLRDPVGLEDNLPITPPEKASESGRQWEAPPFQNEAARSNLTADSIPTDLNWFDRDCVKAWHDMAIPGAKNHTAQVHPYYFTTSIAALAKGAGVNIIEGAKVTDIRCQTKKGVEAVVYEQRNTGDAESAPGSPVEINDVTDVVVCAGPWTGRLIPKSHIETRRAHSVVYEADVTPYAIFTNIELPPDFIPQHRKEKGQPRIHNELVDPEVYARPFGEVYACGETDTRVPLPETADLVEVDKDACDDITAYFSTISPALRNAPVKTRQACYLPSHTRFGKERSPLVGRTGTPGLYLAAGHTCWGIQNGPATGKLMSELLLDGRTKSAKIDELDPRKFQVSAGLARG